MAPKLDDAKLIESIPQLEGKLMITVGAPQAVSRANGEDTGTNSLALTCEEPMFEVPFDEGVFRRLQALPGKTPDVAFDGDDDL